MKMEAADENKKGNVILMGMLIVLLISGLVISSYLLTTSNANSVTDFTEHQKAVYLSRAGVGTVHLNLIERNIAKIPLTQDQAISYTGISGGDTYMVTITRKTATALNILAPITDDDLVAVYEVVSSALVDQSVETFVSVVDVTLATVLDFELNKAIVTEGDITIQGDPTVSGGALADVHTNSDAYLQNGIIVEGDVDAVGNLNIQGTVDVAGAEISGSDANDYGSAHSGAARIPLPTITASEFANVADFKLQADGTIYIKATLTTVPANKVQQHGWKWSNGGGWSVKNGGRPAEGFYFVDDDIHLNHDVGTAGDPFNISIATTGNFTMNGSASYAPYAEDLFVLADVDIAVNGTATATFEGVYLAHEQIEFSGNSTTVGLLISTGTTSTSNVAQKNVLTGTTNFTAGTGLKIPLTSDTPILVLDVEQERKATFDEQTANFGRFGLDSTGQVIQ